MVTAATLALCTVPADAQVTNGSFENGPSTGIAIDIPTGASFASAWTAVGSSGNVTNDGRDLAWLGNGAFGLDTPFGTDFLDLTGFSDAALIDGVSQTISTVAGQSYALTFYLGANAANARYAGPVSALASAGDTSGLFTFAGVTGEQAINTVWGLQTLDFVASDTSTTISIIGRTATGGQFLGLDNVAVTEVGGAVPEPATWAMMIAGFALACAAVRRRSRVLALA